MRALLCLLVLAACNRSPAPAPAPHQIRIVGASAGLPFAADAAERYTLSQPDSIAPLAQADGSAAGIARFCHGVGSQAADLVVETRRMTDAERRDCRSHGVRHIVEIPFGWTAPVFVAGLGASPAALTTEQAVAALTTTARDWSDVDPSLPPVPIRLYGPSGAVLAGDDATIPLRRRPIRHDGGYRALGADAELVATTVAATPGAVGLLPFGYATRSDLRALSLDGVRPTRATIADGRYRPRLPLLLAMRPADIGRVRGLRALLVRFAASIGRDGAFERIGLVPLDEEGRAGAAHAFAAAGIAAQL